MNPNHDSDMTFPVDLPSPLARSVQSIAAAPLDGLVGVSYPLSRWREAIDHASDAGRLGTVKVAFDVRSAA